MKTTETKLKLTLPKTQNAAFKRLLAERYAKAEVAATKRLVSIYFDTPALDLANRDAALRLCQIGGQWLQTLQLREQAGAGLHRRIEQEIPVTGPALELTKISQRKMRRLLSQTHITTTLAPLFTIDIERTCWTLQDERGNSMEVALDQGCIRSGLHTQKINEVEIELKHGEPQALFELALVWAPSVALIPEPKTKAERGYALHRGNAARAAYALIPRQQKKSTPAAAMHAIVLESLRHLQANVPGVLESEDLEFVHQARVALRRLRSALKIFADIAAGGDWQTIMAETQWLAALLGSVRDLDVLLEETLPPIEAALALQTEFMPLKKALAKRRNQSRRILLSALTSPRYATLMLRLLQRLNPAPPEPAAERQALHRFARRALKKCWRQVARRAAQWQSMDREQRHELRKKAKKLRYATEFLSPLYARKPVALYLKRLQRLQHVLGQTNDAAVAQLLMNKLIEQQPALARAAGLATGWLAASAQHSELDFNAAIKKLKQAGHFW